MLIRVLADEVTPAELRKVLRALRDRPELRERCSSLGTFVDASEADRLKCCKSMVEILIGWVEPLTLRDEKSPIVGAHNWPVYGTQAFRTEQLAGIPKFNDWYRHVRRAQSKIHLFEDKCYISEELHTIVAALEDLWGAQNIYTVQAEKRDAVDYMNDELTARGAMARKIRK
ncbi:MAG: hypothetical protein DRQ64_00275 [Gammaproteobacteria bacterium]|nr:MAG: hypothetical protein DRQ64_00275 [Gammaproteobacteria bacterium]